MIRSMEKKNKTGVINTVQVVIRLSFAGRECEF